MTNLFLKKTNYVYVLLIFDKKTMAFSEGISRLQRIIGFISTDYKNKKEIMAFLRNYNIIISYKTLERDLKQIKEVLGIEIEYKRFSGYKCETPELASNFMFSVPNIHLDTEQLKVGFENQSFKVINQFEFEGTTYCNCLDKSTQKVFLMNC
jgi:hypothetical protein